jgi:hypothetical protein
MGSCTCGPAQAQVSPGIALLGGVLAIEGDMPRGNVASVVLNGPTVIATLNGRSQSFPAASVVVVAYWSGPLGGDAFFNETGLLGAEFFFGPGNLFAAGTGVDSVFLYGSGDIVAGNGQTLLYTRGHPTTMTGVIVLN